MAYFLYRLNSPRPTFAQDMSENEAAVMREHAVYWQNLAEKRIAIVVGPVLDPKGPWGVGIVEAENQKAVQAIVDNDPAMRGNIGLTCDIFAMPRVILRK